MKVPNDGGACPERTPITGSVFHYNTFYAEGVGDPTAETVFGTAAAVQELMLGSMADGEAMTVFPAFADGDSVAHVINGSCFHRLRAVGAFLVSGCFRNGKTAFVTVQSEAGRRCRLQLPSLPVAALAVDPPSVSVEVNASTGVVELGLQAGGECGLYTKCASIALCPTRRQFVSGSVLWFSP